jgi:hypothetical protein
VLDRTVAELQAILVLEVCAITCVRLHVVLEAGPIVRVDDGDNHRKCRGDV